MGVFIRISFKVDAIDSRLSRAVASVCPVDIFEIQDEHLVVRPEVEDECTLCGLCLSLAPRGALTIHKLYKDEQLVSNGEASTGVESSL